MDAEQSIVWFVLSDRVKAEVQFLVEIDIDLSADSGIHVKVWGHMYFELCIVSQSKQFLQIRNVVVVSKITILPLPVSFQTVHLKKGQPKIFSIQGLHCHKFTS